MSKTTRYLSPAQIALNWGVARQRVYKLLNAGRIPGATRIADPFGNLVWAIPATAKKPADRKPGRPKTAAKQA